MNDLNTALPTTAQTSQSAAARWPAAFLLLVAIVFAGCKALEVDPADSSDDDSKSKLTLLERLTGKKETTGAKPEPTPLDKKIRWDGSGLVLGETDTAAYSSTSFIESVAGCLKENRPGSIASLVRRYPDVALKVLQDTPPDHNNLAVLQSIALRFDNLYCQANTKQGWSSYVTAMAQAKNRDLIDRKTEFWNALKTNEPEKALGLRLPKYLPRDPNPMVSAEIYRLEAVAMMVNGDYKSAIKRLKKTIDLLAELSPYQAHHLELLLGEFHRHDGNQEAWTATWQRAVQGQSLVVDDANLLDPAFWEKAAFLRPAGLDWPVETIANLNARLEQLNLFNELGPDNQLENEPTVWLTIGIQHLKRNEGQQAILAFKKTEATTRNRDVTNVLHLYQARSLVAAAQPGAASAILFRLISDRKHPLVGDRAKAVLGAMKLQNGAIAQGVNLLNSAIRSADQWPRGERLKGQADHALAMLIRGDDVEGLSLLNQVFQEFKSSGEFEQAHQCLWNKVQYFEQTDQKTLLKKATAELKDFEISVL